MHERAIHDTSKDPLTGIDALAIHLDGDARQRHIGLLYVSSGAQRLRMAHLAWHHRLEDDEPPTGGIWLDVGLDDNNALALASYCEMVVDKSREAQIPYGLQYIPDGLDPRTGAWLGDAGEGLTCATFVMAVFQAYHVPLLSAEGWPLRPEDERWQLKIVELLGRPGTAAAPDHIARQRKYIGEALRFRPEEVAAAAASSDRPLHHDVAIPRGEQIKHALLTTACD